MEIFLFSFQGVQILQIWSHDFIHKSEYFKEELAFGQSVIKKA